MFVITPPPLQPPFLLSSFSRSLCQRMSSVNLSSSLTSSSSPGGSGVDGAVKGFKMCEHKHLVRVREPDPGSSVSPVPAAEPVSWSLACFQDVVQSVIIRLNATPWLLGVTVGGWKWSNLILKVCPFLLSSQTKTITQAPPSFEIQSETTLVIRSFLLMLDPESRRDLCPVPCCVARRH